MTPKHLLLPALWLAGILAYAGQDVEWPWTVSGKESATKQARQEERTEDYKKAIAALRSVAPGLAALDQLEHPDFPANRSIDTERLLQVALASPETREKAQLIKAQMLLRGSPNDREQALALLGRLAQNNDPTAVRLLLANDEDADLEVDNTYSLPKSPRSAAVITRALQTLEANPELLLSSYQLRDLNILRRRLLELEANDDNASSMVELAELLFQQGGSPSETREAIALYERAMKRGSLSAQVGLGKTLRDAQGKLRDVPRALRLLEDATKRGSYGASYQLAETHRRGLGVKPDMKRALPYYKNAVKGGSTGAMYRIGDMYMRGDGLPKRPEIAVQWFRDTASAGSPSGLRALGEAYMSGQGVPESTTTGLRLISRAANLGDVPSMAMLARIYSKGLGVERDFSKSGDWALRAVAAGDRRGTTLVTAAQALASGTREKSDPLRAAQLLRIGVKRGNDQARLQLANLLLSTGGEKNEREALSLFRRGAISGDPRSLAALGSLYASGNGVPVDADRSRLYYTVAARKGSAEGLRGLAIASASGFGVPQDMAAAVRYFELAGAANDAKSLVALGNCYLNACLGARDVSKAAAYFRTAADGGSADANYEYAVLMLNGVVEGGRAGAIARLNQAARKHHTAALKQLDKLGIAREPPPDLAAAPEKIAPETKEGTL